MANMINQSSNTGHHAQQHNSSPTSHQNQLQQHQPPLSHPQQPAYQPTPHMSMQHHHNMHGHQVHPHQHQGQHQQRPHSSMMQQHERSNSGPSGGTGVHPPLSLTTVPGGGAGRGHTRPHSLSAPTQPPPHIPNASLQSPTMGTHAPNSFTHGPPQLHGLQGQQQQQHQQQQNGGDRRSSVSSRMSLSPTIPLSTSRMEPPSTLDIGR
jgi:hypothetical protein